MVVGDESLSHEDNSDAKSPELAAAELNNHFEELVWYDEVEDCQKPHVCTICDTFQNNSDGIDTLELEKFEDLKDVLVTSSTKELHKDLKSCYKFPVPSEFAHHVKGVLLSPRGRYIPPRHRLSGEKDYVGSRMSVCKACKKSLQQEQMPRFAIANGYFFGTSPKCLSELTDIERAWITPVKTFGIVYVYTGGPQQQLQGTASFYKRDKSGIARAAAQLELLGLTKDGVSIVLLGAMTPKQIREAKRKAMIRPDKILEAVEWLIAHNEDWESIDFDEIKLALQARNPVIVRDDSTPAEEVQANVESVETFRVYFPDGQLQSGLGGQQTCSDFLRAALNEKAANETTSTGAVGSDIGAIGAGHTNSNNVFLHAKFQHERVYDYKDKNLVNACLLQFPFGRGSLMSEQHYDRDGSQKGPTHEEYIEHLSKISQPHFHNQLFSLILFNYLMKDWMVRKAAVACKNEGTASLLAENLTSAELFEALDQRRKKKPITSPAARKMLSTLEAVAACAPHTNEAAKKAKYKVEAMQCHFGLPSWFLTVTPDDENSVLLQVYSGNNINLDVTTWEQVEQMTDKELSDKAIQKRNLRFSYPGIAALNFESQRDAIIKYVIGWEMKKKGSSENPGLFGKCKAFVLSVEEQGRKSLHMHILIWIDSASNATSCLYNGTKKRKRDARGFICEQIDRVSSCELIGTSKQEKRRKVFHHESCETFNSVRHPREPELISAQRLRDLRNSEGMKLNSAHMKCHYCDTQFSSHEIIANYLQYLGMENLKKFPDTKSKRVKAMSMALINGGGTDYRAKPVFNAAYNHHVHTQTSCFCKKYNGKCTSVDCRYKYPKLLQTKTTLIDTGTDTQWFNVDGSYHPRSIFEIASKRHVTDVFMNQHCLGIGMTKLINGNTNLSFLTPGPVALYTTKYNTKGTQKQDGSDYEYLSERVLKAVHRIDIENLERKQKERDGTLTDAERRATNESSAITKVLRLGFTRHEPNIVGAPLASYLIRNKSRFVFSHDFQFVPIWDTETLLNGSSVKLFLMSGKSGSYCSNSAYDYICRPEACEDLSMFEFMEGFEVVRQRPTKDNELLSFKQVNNFLHPSWKEEKSRTSNDGEGWYRAGVRMKKTGDDDDEKPKPLLQIPSYYFPDSASFNGTISEVTSKETEEYSRKALMLFKPFRELKDLRTAGFQTKEFVAQAREKIPLTDDEDLFITDIAENGSYTETLRRWLGQSTTDTKRSMAFLQNFQDCSYNCTRKSGRMGDELDRMTHKYRAKKGGNSNDDDMSTASDQESPDLHGENRFFDEAELADLVAQLCPEIALQETATKQVPGVYLTKNIRDKGKLRCGYEHIALMNPSPMATSSPSSNDGLLEEPEGPAEQGPTVTRKPWLEISSANSGENTTAYVPNSNGNSGLDSNEEVAPSKSEIVEIIIQKKERVVRQDKMFKKDAEVAEANGSRESIRAWSKAARLDLRQRMAFEIIIASFVLTFFQGEDDNPRIGEEQESDWSTEEGNKSLLYATEKTKLETLADLGKRGGDQLVALLYGAGGAGKSFVIDLVLLYAKEYCSKFENFVFDKRTIVVTAMTGCAATLLNGETAHGALKLNTRTKNLDEEDMNAWKRTRLMIIDEISFASREMMEDINTRLKYLRELEETDPTLFGGVHMVFAGDFRQLDPVSMPPLYMTSYGLETKVNCFLELTGMHRFKTDKAWGLLLKKFRDGTVEKSDVDRLNLHLRNNNKNLPDNLKYATYRNSDRDAINMALFDKAVAAKTETEAEKFGLLVFADEIHLKTGKNRYAKRLGTCNLLYAQSSESDVKTVGNSSQRMDPVLKLYEGIRILLTKNEDVLNGIANGTQAEVVRVVLKACESYQSVTINDGNGTARKVKAVLAS